jgi:hypothetical protein
MGRRISGFLLLLFGCAGLIASGPDEPSYSWLNRPPGANAICDRFPVPPRFQRTTEELESFAFWLRHLPLKDRNALVRLYDGSLKVRQDVHAAVIDIDTGDRDLQQCADAVIRLRAEFLWQRREFDRIRFDFLNGFTARYSRWREGYRFFIAGTEVRERRSAAPDDTHGSFRRYLDAVFRYANTSSLYRELEPVVDVSDIRIGDVWICRRPGGGPCHAELVVDLAEDGGGKKIFLLAQGFMPAQEIHVLKNPRSDSPWYEASIGETLVTPEWVFDRHELRRFRP